MVALGDLAFRFPNAAEPWTEHLYGVREWGNSLHDPDSGVRQHAITVLAHLVLNDMMKVKGHIAEMARCLEDPDPRVAAVAKLLFAELSRKHGNPIYNLLPDLLSRLSGDAATSPEAFRAIMTRLLGFIDKDRQTEALADKFVHRFAEAALAPTPKPGATQPTGWALALSDRAFKKFMDAWKLYDRAVRPRGVRAPRRGGGQGEEDIRREEGFRKKRMRDGRRWRRLRAGGAAEGDRGLRARNSVILSKS